MEQKRQLVHRWRQEYPTYLPTDFFLPQRKKQVFYFVQKWPYFQRTNIPLIRLVHTLSNTRFRCYTVGMKNSLQCLLIFLTQYKIVLCTKHIFQPKQSHQNILEHFFFKNIDRPYITNTTLLSLCNKKNSYSRKHISKLRPTHQNT